MPAVRSLEDSPRGGDPVEKARAVALRLLKFRVRSETELRERLQRKGVHLTVVETLLKEYKRKGFIDDAKFARYFATQQMLSKPMARRALLNKLKGRGIEPSLATQAVEDATEGTTEMETARDLALARLSKLKGFDRQTIQRRLFGFLVRRGFSSDVAVRVVREVSQDSE